MPYPGYAGWVLQLDPEAVATNRVMLDINDPDVSGISIGGTSGDSGGIDWGQAAITEFASQQGQYGNSVADFIIPNRTVTIPIGLGMSSSPDAPDPETALRNLSMKVALLQREGGWLMRQRQNLDGSTGDPLYADVVDAQLDVPDDWMETAGVEPSVTLTLTCLPDFYGDEIELDTMYCTGFCTGVLTLGGEQAVIAGDYPARCQIAVGGFSLEAMQASVIWGVRSRYYDPASTAALVYSAMSTGNPGSGTTLASSQFPKVANLGPGSSSIDVNFGADNLTHVGTYRFLARVYAGPGDTQVQLGWHSAFSVITNAAVDVPATNVWCLMDLGVVRIEPLPPSLQQQWEGTLYTTTGESYYVAVDYFMLVPLDEGAGVVGSETSPAIENGDVLIRDDGSYWNGGSSGMPVVGVGDLARLPPSGLEERPLQLLVKPSEGAQPNAEDPGVDAFTVTPTYRPTYLSRI